MRRFPILIVLLTACGSTPPPPAQPTQQVESKATPAGTETRASTSLTAESTPKPEKEPAPAAPATPKRPKNTADKISARHVLIQYIGSERAAPSVVRSREQAYSLAQEVHRRAKAKEDFARLAVEYSDEPNAAQRGGSLGRFGHGQMVGAFDDAVFKLDVGEVSDIVETPFGYHVIQRTE